MLNRLAGFGDIFPAEPKIILVNTVFIVMGVVLFSMCYFILQEEIREKVGSDENIFWW